MKFWKGFKPGDLVKLAKGIHFSAFGENWEAVTWESVEAEEGELALVLGEDGEDHVYMRVLRSDTGAEVRVSARWYEEENEMVLVERLVAKL